MHIDTLYLKQFRNYKQMGLDVDNTINLILGENAQGKTNMMEAVYVLAFAKSHRTSKDKELIQWEEDFARIEAEISRKTGPLSLEVIISSRGKKTKVNGLEQRKLSEYIGALNVVMFAPEDLNLVKGGPQLRRRFIDMEIGQISPVYLHNLTLYQRVLKQRNQLLKNMFPVPDHEQEMMLDVLTDQLARAAAQVIVRRFSFLRMLAPWSQDIHRQISREKEELSLTYVPTAEVSEGMDLSMIEEKVKEKLMQNRQNEIRRGVTLSGPHRDELSLCINNKEVQTFGSQGQQRTAALSLKLAEIELINDNIGEYPILLLDDVLSELDNHRQSHLLHAIEGKVQTFVTATGVNGVEHQTLKKASTYYAEAGTLRQVK
ncbi:DNA replication/repair protein RecF [Bacillus piscicola]|uniref:DNA replication/repair protein RecF n=1 Tax=Bacillus piscicola TaxID=1632684 RepID=UPI001F09BBE5|nr:DNA replication/repair protein RecF [Bacillus piscicola]